MSIIVWSHFQMIVSGNVRSFFPFWKNAMLFSWEKQTSTEHACRATTNAEKSENFDKHQSSPVFENYTNRGSIKGHE